MVEVGAERSPGDGRLEVLVGRRHEADVHGDFARTAHAADAAFLQGAQQLHLRLIGEVAHLVEKERAAVGRLEGSRLVGQRSGERPFDVAEELRCGQLARDGSAIDRHERFSGAPAAAVDQLRHVLLARSARAVHQHRHVGGGHQPHVFVELPRRVAAPLDVVERFGRRAPGRARGIPAGPSGFLPGCRGVERLADLLQQFVGVHGFGHVVARAEFHAPHGVPYLGVARHHDHRSRDALAGHPLQQGDPVFVR